MFELRQLPSSTANPQATSLCHRPQGVFNGVSAGILLYVGFSMAAEDLSREDVVRDGNLSAGMAACIFVSAFLMSLLAMWA